MSNETLMLKTAVVTNSTVKLTDCPMSSGEILEMVCRLYANGLTSGNRCFKAIGNAVTYNTDAVTEGDIYCVSYRDGGFYVGLRTTEDYEPKEGDWWCFFNDGKNERDWNSSYNIKQVPYKVFREAEKLSFPYFSAIFTFNEHNRIISYLRYSNDWGKPLQSRSQVLLKEQRFDIEPATTLGYDNGMSHSSVVTNEEREILYNDTNTLMMFKKITPSDILSYQNTGKMGGIILGEELEVTNNIVTSSKQILYDSNTQIAVFIFDENGNMINLNMSSVSGCIGIKGSICKLNADDSSKNSIFNIYSISRYNYMYIYQYDYASYFENDIKHRLTFERTNGSEYSYTIRAFKVLQNNMATSSLLSNNLNPNSNDETNV